MIYLASQSTRRQLLLKQIVVGFQTLPSSIDEAPLNEESAVDYVLRIAANKVESGWQKVQQQQLPEFPVLAADTSVVLDQKILGKPVDKDHAYDMLTQLQGRTHQVMTAVAITNGMKSETILSISDVKMGEISARKIKDYIGTEESMDKAGSYAIQGLGAVLIERIEGSYSGVMGLPLYEVEKLLNNFGVLAWQNPCGT